MKKQTLSACLTVYNEESAIQPCLESLKDVADEIIVVHDGPCKDNTLNIAKRYGAKIYEAQRAGSAELLRPLGFEKAKGDWILVIDADERLSPELRNSIKNLINDESVDEYSFLWCFTDKNRKLWKGVNVSYISRLFRKNKMYHIGLPHQSQATRGKAKRDNRIIEHFFEFKRGPLSLFIADLRKNKQRAKVYAKMLAGPLNNIPLFQCSWNEKDIKQKRKMLWQKKYPYLALFIMPAYSFFYHLLIQKHYREGRVGLVRALNIPLFHFFSCCELIRLK